MVPEIGKVLRIISMPLLIISGVIFPLNFLPHELLVYVMWNPIVHGLESLRGAFFPLYRPITGTSLLYLWYWILGMATLGLMLHVRFELRLKRQ
jgi:capsular polysaccharide transport system permease protein